MTWLKTFGLEVLKIVNVVVGILSTGQIQQAAPGAAGVINTIESDLTEFASIITDIETGFAGAQASGAVALPPQTGPLKLAAAVPLVSQQVLKSAVMKGQEVKNEALYKTAVTGYAQATVDLLNSLDPKTVKTAKP
jgi:lysozyme family protein